MDLFNDNNHLQVTEEPENKCISFNWTHFGISLEEVRKAHYAALEVVKAKGYKVLIANTGSVEGVLYPEVISMLENEMIGKYIEGGVKAVITVVPQNALGRLSTKDWQKQIVGALTTLNVRSMTEARAAAIKLAK
jgi:hypothetical protein